MNNSIPQLMQSAIDAARKKQTPYGAAILDPRNGRKVVTANTAGETNDPTAHAEINAIRAAVEQGIDLQHALLISTCEPCPMCAMAAVWSGIKAIYFGAGIDDAAKYGNQVHIYSRDFAAEAWYELKVEGGILREECLELFRE